MQTINDALDKFEGSKFRASFKLAKKDIAYINEKGLEKIKEHARDFVKKRLSAAYIPNDGSQTPTSGHPVFKAQHACACCCRGCLYKWYKVKQGVDLTDEQQEKIVSLLMAWIERQMERK